MLDTITDPNTNPRAWGAPIAAATRRRCCRPSTTLTFEMDGKQYLVVGTGDMLWTMVLN